jgi:hypothetical protein
MNFRHPVYEERNLRFWPNMLNVLVPSMGLVAHCHEPHPEQSLFIATTSRDNGKSMRYLRGKFGVPINDYINACAWTPDCSLRRLNSLC